jgi:hypothetical protein
MSGTADYSLEIRLDDAQLRRQIEEIKKAFGGSGSGSGGGSRNSNQNQQGMVASLDKVFGGLGKKGMLSIVSMGLKLSGMAIMMDKISKSLVNASPMLQQMLKLLDTGIMFMLRPIGDFIGFLLKPIVLFFFKYVAIPFYRYIEPFMQKYGTAIGQALTDPTVGIPAAVGVLIGLKLISDKILTGVGNFTSKTIAGGVKQGMEDYDASKASASSSNNASSDKNTSKKSTSTPKDPFDPNTDMGGTAKPSSSGGASVSVDPKTGRITVTTKAGTSASSPSQGGVKTVSSGSGTSFENQLGGDSLTGGTTDLKSLQTYVSKAIGAKANILNDAQKMMADRISGGDYEYAKSMVKLAPNILKGVLKYLPELGILIAAITGDASWIVPGYGGTAGGGESGGLNYNNPPPAFANPVPGQGTLSMPKPGTQNGGTNINVNVNTLDFSDPATQAGLKRVITQYMQTVNGRKPAG